MHRLLLNEFKKQNILVIIIFTIILSVGLNLLAYYSSDNNTIDNWRENAISEKAEFEEYLAEQEAKKDTDKNEEIISQCQSGINEINYCLENDIPYEVVSLGGYLININGMDTFIFMIIIIFSARVFIIEDDNKTWKNLFTTNVKRRKILESKILFGIVMAIAISVIFFVVCLVNGIALGNMELTSTIRVWNADHYMVNSLASKLFSTYMIFIIKAIFFSVFVIMISGLCKLGYVTYLISIIALLFGDLVEGVMAGKEINNYLPFKYLFSTANSVFFESSLLLKTCLVLIPWSLLFAVIALLGFNGRNNRV